MRRPTRSTRPLFRPFVLGFGLVFLTLLGGCNSVEETKLQRSVSESIARQIQEFDSADARAVVAARVNAGNLNFLGFAGEPREPSFLPGLSQEEIQQLKDSKHYHWEVFYYYHGRSELGSAEEEKALRNSRQGYAERINRELWRTLQQEKIVH